MNSSQTAHQVHSPLAHFPCCFPVWCVLLQCVFHQPDPRITPACRREVDREGKRNCKNCSSAKNVLSFLKSCFVLALETSLSKLCISSFFPFSLFLSLFPPLFLPPSFLPIFRTTILCEEGRSVLFTDPR